MPGVAIYLYVYAERHDSGWHLVAAPEVIGEPEWEGQVEWVYRRHKLVDIFTNWGLTAFAEKIEPLGTFGTVPEDLSAALREVLDDRPIGWTDARGHVALSELLEFDWDRSVGIVEERVKSEYAHRFDAEQPFPEDLFDVPLSPMLEEGTLIRYTETYRGLAGHEFLASIHAIAAYAGNAPVRLIYWAG